MQALLVFSRTVDRLTRGLGRVLIWLTLVMVLVSAWNALGGYIGKRTHLVLTSNSLQELSWYLFSLLFLFGGSWALLENAHVKVDLFLERFSQAWKHRLTLATMLLLVVPFCVALLWTCWPFVQESLRIREQSPDPGGLPRWPLKLAILPALALLLAQALSEAIKAAHALTARREAAA
jgi:TRAP-type mannitol/chloroaromatic compound transport system permease small subunit